MFGGEGICKNVPQNAEMQGSQSLPALVRGLRALTRTARSQVYTLSRSSLICISQESMSFLEFDILNVLFQAKQGQYFLFSQLPSLP